jgi:hypothetical protein
VQDLDVAIFPTPDDEALSDGEFSGDRSPVPEDDDARLARREEVEGVRAGSLVRAFDHDLWKIIGRQRTVATARTPGA